MNICVTALVFPHHREDRNFLMFSKKFEILDIFVPNMFFEPEVWALCYLSQVSLVMVLAFATGGGSRGVGVYRTVGGLEEEEGSAPFSNLLEQKAKLTGLW